MTTIILTIIGILLAAAAALMVIFYGGDAFNAGSVGARANTLQNAGTNVLSAVQLARADGKPVSSIDALTDLTGTAGTDNNYLKELPSFASVNSAIGASDVVITDGNLTIAKIPDAVCRRVNKNLGLGTGAVVSSGNKMGCVAAATGTADGTFFANA